MSGRIVRSSMSDLVRVVVRSSCDTSVAQVSPVVDMESVELSRGESSEISLNARAGVGVGLFE